MLNWIDQRIPVRFIAFFAVVALWVLSALQLVVGQTSLWVVLCLTGLVVLGVHDLQQKTHAILRNYPIIGHLRFLLEFIRPELRQYFIEGDDDAVPFSRSQRSLVYARAKGEPDKRPFGTQMDVRAVGYEWLTHSLNPSVIASRDFRVQVGGAQCAQPYNISLFNVSAMSFGALSANAIMALNLGAKRGGFAHDTGEGSISRYHREHGGDLIWEIGSGYFGCRNDDGTFNADAFKQNALSPQVKMIEIKLSQGAKPGHGGVLPGPKVTPEIAEARGVPVGVDCVSPAAHSSFSTPLELLQFLQKLRELSEGKPVGFKLCIGHPWEWFGIAKAMKESNILPDFIVVDGAEGGTGAAPLEFTDHMGMPLLDGLHLVHNTLVGLNFRKDIRLGASGKIINGFDVMRTVALGADWCNSARGFMFALGCIQAQTCHTGNCPTGVATQDPKRQIALVVPTKADRVQNFHHETLESVREMLQATGLQRPSDLSLKHIMRRVSALEVQNLSSLMPGLTEGALLNGQPLEGLYQQYWQDASANSFAMNSKT
ncbi:MAG: Glutamate synthase large chain [Pseudomonadota bacterium]